MRIIFLSFLVLVMIGGSACRNDRESTIDSIAGEYVRLALQLNTHDDGYVDAYYGDPAWRAEAEASPASVAKIRERAGGLLKELEGMPGRQDQAEMFSRARYLSRHLSSMIARIDMLEGRAFSFDEEALAIYDSKPPHFSEAHFDSVLVRIDKLIPGSGTLTDRVEAFRNQFIIPEDRLDAVFQEAMSECRRRTLAHIELPEGERFTVEYVTDKPWSAYNWFKGNAVSLIEVNTESPTRIDGAIHLACHEGYPGHHVFSTLREKRYREEGWVEFSMLPLYAPIAPIAEGSANLAKRIAFPDDERARFEKEVLFPLAGLDVGKADLYYELLDQMSALSFARNEAARKYLSGEWDVEKTVSWLMKYQLMSEQRSRQTIRFIDTYRAYVLNYNYGEDLTTRYVYERAATPDEAWKVFERLLSAPVVPSDLY